MDSNTSDKTDQVCTNDKDNAVIITADDTQMDLDDNNPNNHAFLLCSICNNDVRRCTCDMEVNYESKNDNILSYSDDELDNNMEEVN